MTDRTAFLRACGEVIADAIARRDTHHAIFHGCYDWHSAVHGHFALLRLARVLGDPRFAEPALAALTPERLALEAQLLREKPAFEMPYGRAWLLRLAIEHGGTALEGIASEVARSLVDRFDYVAPHPATREYANGSWAIAQLAAWAEHAQSRHLADWVERIIEDNFLDPDEVPALDDDRVESDFFSPHANWLYLLARTRPASLAIGDLDLLPVKVNGRAHHYGVNWSRAWMLHRLSLIDPRYRDAYEAHVDAGIADHARAATDYLGYGHWVPQFAVYAITEDVA